MNGIGRMVGCLGRIFLVVVCGCVVSGVGNLVVG